MTQGSKSKTFCAMAWTHLATYTDGATGLCCIAKTPKIDDTNVNYVPPKNIVNHSHWKETRLKMLAGEEVLDCKKCYEEERNNCSSHRNVENIVWQQRLGEEGLEELIRNTKSDGSISNDIMSLDLRLGNTCNLQCVMCAPTESSKWLSASKRFLPELTGSLEREWTHKSNIQKEKYEWYKNQKFWDNVYDMIPNLQEVILAGGEPLLIEQQYKFLEEAVRTGHSKHMLLRYHTNGTILNLDLLKMLESFKKVEFFVSLDAVAEQNYWIRYPADWDTIVTNLHILDKTNDNIEIWILNSLQAINIYYVTEFTEFIIEQNFQKISKQTKGHFHPGIVHYPNYLNPKVLPSEMKKMVTRQAKLLEEHYGPAEKILGIVNFMNSEDWSHELPTLRNYIEALDKTRGTDFKSTFPEIAGYIFDE